MKKIITSFIAAGVILTGGAGAAVADFQPVTSCKSNIFDCSKQLAYLPLPSGKRCSTSTITLNKSEQILMTEGDTVTLFHNPKTQQAVACVNGNKGTCPDTSGFISVGTNQDGSTHQLVLTGGDSLVIPNPAPIFATLMANAKPLIEVISQPVVQDCDIVLADIKVAAEKAGYVPPSMDFVELGGVQVPVGVAQFSVSGNRAALLYTYDYSKLVPPPNPLPANEGQLVSGIAVVTIGDTQETFTRVFKLLPGDITGFTGAGTLAVMTSNDQVMNVVISLIKPDESVGVFACSIPLDAVTPVSCKQEGVWPKGDKTMWNFILTASLKERTLLGTGSEALGAGLADILITQNLPVGAELVAHNFEGFGDVPNAVYYDQTGGHVYRLNPDKAVTVDANEQLPSAKKCILADLDEYAGKDLVCFEGDGQQDMVYFLPKRNLAPMIDLMTIQPIADQFQLSASVRTQEGEVLAYAWDIYRMKGNLLTKIEGALSKATDEKPVFSLSSLGSNLSEGGFFAMLTVKDAGGLSNTVMGPIPMASLAVVPVAPLAPVAPVAAVEPVAPVTPVAPLVIPISPAVPPADVPVLEPKAATVPLEKQVSNADASGMMVGMFGGCSLIR